MERNEERPDARFWTSYDYYMIERDARAMRRQHMLAALHALCKRAGARFAQSLRNAGAQPVRAQRTTAA